MWASKPGGGNETRTLSIGHEFLFVFWCRSRLRTWGRCRIVPASAKSHNRNFEGFGDLGIWGFGGQARRADGGRRLRKPRGRPRGSSDHPKTQGPRPKTKAVRPVIPRPREEKVPAAESRQSGQTSREVHCLSCPNLAAGKAFLLAHAAWRPGPPNTPTRIPLQGWLRASGPSTMLVGNVWDVGQRKRPTSPELEQPEYRTRDDHRAAARP